MILCGCYICKVLLGTVGFWVWWRTQVSGDLRHEPRGAKRGTGEDQEIGGGEWLNIRNSIVIGNNDSWWQWPMMHNDHQTPDTDTLVSNLETVSVMFKHRPLTPGWSVICEHSESISIKSLWLMLDHFTAPKRRYWELEIRHNWLTWPLTIPPRLMAWNLTHNDDGQWSRVTRWSLWRILPWQNWPDNWDKAGGKRDGMSYY